MKTITTLTDKELEGAFIEACTCLFGELEIEREPSWVMLTHYIEETEISLFLSNSGEVSYTSDAESEMENSLPINAVKLIRYLDSLGVEYTESAAEPLWIGLRTGSATSEQIDDYLVSQGVDPEELNKQADALFEKFLANSN